MISRLTTAAVMFAVLAGTSIALATTVSAGNAPSPVAAAAAAAADAKTVRVFELPRVTIVAKRLPA